MAYDVLPLVEQTAPNNLEELVDVLRDAKSRGVAVYPIGGGTSLDFGRIAQTPGVGVVLTRLNRVIDYPARDLTITVQAGITMRELAKVLAAEGQWLPVDVPQADQATLGGVIATGFSGPRRFGHGTVRDYVIGIEAITVDGQPFKAGGRVVKNVAGYDFCKLLTGSLGTLAILTQVTLKVKPRTACSRMVACRISDWAELEPRLGAVNCSSVTPTAIEVQCGKSWSSIDALRPLHELMPSPPVAVLALLLEGSLPEVEWQTQQLVGEWRQAGSPALATLDEAATSDLVAQWTEFPVSEEPQLVLKASMLPSAVADFLRRANAYEPAGIALAHAGDGVVLLKYARQPAGGIGQLVVRQLGPLAKAAHGHVVILAASEQAELTRQAVWGAGGMAYDIMSDLKRAFDPQDRLNPGRFVYA